MHRRDVIKLIALGMTFPNNSFSQQNVSMELSELLNSNHQKLPSHKDIKIDESIKLANHERISKSYIPNSSYGCIVFERYRQNHSSTINKNDLLVDTLVIYDHLSRVEIGIYRFETPTLEMNVSSDKPGRYLTEFYIDSDLDGTPERGYVLDGLQIHGIPENLISKLNEMQPGKRDFFTTTFTHEMNRATSALKEYLKIR